MTALGLLVLFGGAAYVARWWMRYSRYVAAGCHLHRPVVVWDESVDLCESCGELINR